MMAYGLVWRRVAAGCVRRGAAVRGVHVSPRGGGARTQGAPGAGAAGAREDGGGGRSGAVDDDVSMWQSLVSRATRAGILTMVASGGTAYAILRQDPEKLDAVRELLGLGPMPRANARAAVPGELRELEAADYDKGFLDLLGQLTEVGSIPRDAFEARLREMKREPQGHVVLVAEDAQGRVVASGTVSVERKFIHGLGQVGHIEDVVVHKSTRGTGLGKKLVVELKRRALHELGCYKVILDCDDKNVKFYQKCGFTAKERMMAAYLKDEPKQAAA